MRAALASLNECAVPFLSHADVNLCWHYYTLGSVTISITTTGLKFLVIRFIRDPQIPKV